jgi:hypothetical protein
MQLDIFEHSRDVMLRNSVVDALRDRNATATAHAIAELAAEYANDSMLPVFNLLCERLALRVTGPLNRVSASEILRATEGAVAAAAQRVFGGEAEIWLSPLWTELATATKGLPFDARNEALHAVPFLLRAGRWADACTCLESIPSWRRQPAPLAWKIEATARIVGADPLWPLLAELSWMAPRRAEALTERLKMAELTTLVRSFNGEFEGNGTASDFAWFPAWVLIVYPRLADRFHGAQTGADTPPEHCARLVLDLLAFERQGRHGMLIEGRKKLRDAHRMLFERYMQSRSASLNR